MDPTSSLSVRDDAFELSLLKGAHAVVHDCRRDHRHLLLSLQDPGAAPQRFLCGFDERHWFAASVKGHTVAEAKDNLLPPAARAAAMHAGLRRAHMFRRHNSAFIRQGEWFFVPASDVAVDPLLIRRREPLIRPGGGKPHVVDEMVRGQGESVWHHETLAPSGIDDAAYRALPTKHRKAAGWSRRMRVAGTATVLVRGAVRHADHATIHLNGWHRVYINREVRSASLGFLD